MGGNKKSSAMDAANAQRNREMEIINYRNAQKSKAFEYQSMFSSALQKARLEAEGEVTLKRSEGLKENSSLLTNYQEQERRRLFKAKRGVGQVDESDYSIDPDRVAKAKNFFDLGDDYWEVQRRAAGEEARKLAETEFLNKYGLEDEYVKRETAGLNPAKKPVKKYWGSA